MKRIFIIVPSLVPTGPVKGAVALANKLVLKTPVTIVALRQGAGCAAVLNPSVDIVCLDTKNTNVYNKFKKLKCLILNSGANYEVATISFCFSADLFNLFCRKYALTCSSVRGNLINIYRMDYGFIGLPSAILHLISFAYFDLVFVMSASMRRQVALFSRREGVVVGNFVDEKPLASFKKSSYVPQELVRFVFVGHLNYRKDPLLLVRAFAELKNLEFNVSLEMIGDGPLRTDIIQLIESLGLKRDVKISGSLSEPFPNISNADIFVLPSKSEGTSRASLEALYLGLPVVLRAIDGNRELVHEGVNGVLFDNDHDLSSAMISAIGLLKKCEVSNLLPEFYKQELCCQQYFSAIEAALLEKKHSIVGRT